MIEVVLNDRLGKKIRVKCKCAPRPRRPTPTSHFPSCYFSPLRRTTRPQAPVAHMHPMLARNIVRSARFAAPSAVAHRCILHVSLSRTSSS